MLAALAGVSKTDESGEMDESSKISSESQQFATNPDYQIGDGGILEDQGTQASTGTGSQQWKAIGMFGGLSDVFDQDRIPHVNQGQKVQSEILWSIPLAWRNT